MQYMGGKSRISKYISEVINEVSRRKVENCIEDSGHYLGGGINNDCFVSLFCGSCSVESKVKGFSRKILNDKHKYLIDLLNGVKNGYDLPEKITEEEYKYIREHKDDDPVLTGFVGFGCSFGGKWFGGYANGVKTKIGTVRNYTDEAIANLIKQAPNLTGINFAYCDFRNIPIDELGGVM